MQQIRRSCADIGEDIVAIGEYLLEATLV